jgi:hypothetical protein
LSGTVVGFCSQCVHCQPDLPRTNPLDIEIGKQAERAVPAVFRKLYFSADQRRKPELLRALEKIWMWVSCEGPAGVIWAGFARRDGEWTGLLIQSPPEAFGSVPGEKILIDESTRDMHNP